MSGVAASSLPDMLGRLKLTAMRDRLDVLLDEAARRELNLPEALTLLCEAEVAHREERRIQMGLGIAKFPYLRTLEGFDFAAQPSLDPKQVRDLAACRWVAAGDALLVLGPPGVGKTHLAIALAVAACQTGYSIYFTTLDDLVRQLRLAEATGRFAKKLQTYLRPAVLVLDEVGYLPLDRAAANMVFQLISRRYERGSVILTSNKTFSEWGSVFADDVLAAAILDRLLHDAEVLAINGPSYRLKGRLDALRHATNDHQDRE